MEDTDTEGEFDALQERLTDLQDERLQVITAFNNSPFSQLQLGPPPNATPSLILEQINQYASIREHLEDRLNALWDMVPIDYIGELRVVMDYLQGNINDATVTPIVQNNEFWSWYNMVPTDFLINLAVAREDDNILDNVVNSLWESLDTGEGVAADVDEVEESEGEEHEGAGRSGGFLPNGSYIGQTNEVYAPGGNVTYEWNGYNWNPVKKGGSLVSPFHLKPGTFY